MLYDQGQQAYCQAVGTSPNNYPHIDTRDPNSNDVQFFPSGIGKIWINKSANKYWYVAAYSTITGYLQATWVILSGSLNPSISQIAVDTSSGSGTNPVVADSTGKITITGAQVPAGVIGTNVIRIDSVTANAFKVEVQVSSTSATSDATKNGVAHFKSTDFTVDANGFVELTSAPGFDWNIVSTNQSMVRNNGYIVVSPGGAITMALPSTASSVLGDLIEVTLDGATSWQITQAAGQQIRFSGSQTTVGVGGSITTTSAGDSVRLVYQTTGKWNCISAIGNLTVV